MLRCGFPHINEMTHLWRIYGGTRRYRKILHVLPFIGKSCVSALVVASGKTKGNPTDCCCCRVVIPFSWLHFHIECTFCISHITHTPREQAQSVTLGDNHHNTLRHGYVVVLVFPLTWTRQCGDIIIISSVYPCRRHSSFIHSFPSAHTKSIMKFCLCAFCEIEIRIFTTSSRDIAKNRRDVAKP